MFGRKPIGEVAELLAPIMPGLVLIRCCRWMGPTRSCPQQNKMHNQKGSAAPSPCRLSLQIHIFIIVNAISNHVDLIVSLRELSFHPH